MPGPPRRSARTLLAVLLWAGAISGCRQTTPSPTGLGLPQIQSVSPSVVQPGAGPQVLTFTGVNVKGTFSLLMIAPGGSTTVWLPSDIQVLATDKFQVSVTLTSPGVYAFEIRSPTGELSSAFDLTVGDVAGFPAITSISPPAAHPSAQTQSFVVGGTSFETGLQIVLAAPDGTVSTVSSSDVAVTADTMVQVNLLLTKTGAYLVSIVNPSGGTSNLFPISVTK